MSNSNIETITREHDNFSSSYSELVNLLEKVITNREITQDDKYDLEKAHATYTENYNEVKRILENEKEANLREQIKAVNDNKLDADINSIVNILTNNGEKNTLYLDEDGNLYIDGEKIPEIKQVKLTVDEQNGKIESLVSDGFIEDAEGNKVKLKVLYSTLKQDMNGFKSQVGEISGVASSAKDKAQAALDKYSQIEQTVGKIQTTVVDNSDKIKQGVTKVYNEYYISTSKTEQFGGTWSTTVPTNVPEGSYLWIRTVYTKANGNSSTGDAVCMAGVQGPRGLQGLQGPQGEQGIQGPAGESGKTSYFHIKYSSVKNPTSSSQMTETPSEYIGTYVDFTEQDSDDPSKYEWYRFQGLQGPQGEQGIPGKDGDGRTTYLHIKYSNDGGKTFTTNNGEDVGVYIGTCTDFNKDDPTTIGSYTWAKIKGDTGVGVKKITTIYFVSTSKTTVPTFAVSGWLTYVPAYQEGKYLWSAYKIFYDDDTVNFTDPQYCSEWEALSVAQGAKSVATQTKEQFEWIVMDGSTSSSITLTNAALQAIANSDILFKAKNIKLEGYTTINGGFSIDESGNMTANNGNFNGAVNAQGNMTADTLIVRKIVSKDIINSLTSDISVTIATDGDDASTVISSAKFYTVQGFLDALPKNLNGSSIYITLDKECNENLNLEGFSNGDIYLYMNMKNYNGNIAGYNCTAKLFIYGATTVTGIPDGVNSQRPSVMPASMVGSNTYYYGMYFSNCNFVTLRSINVYGQTTSNSYYAIGAEHGTTLLMQNCKVIGSQNGVQARGSKVILYKNYGKVNNNAVRAIYGAVVCIQDGSIPNGQLTRDSSSQIIYDSTKCTVDGTTTNVGENTNTGTTTSKSVTFTSDYGDTYRYTWSDWAQDNLVIQGKWTSNSVGCWFFGSDFTKLKGKTITKVVLKIERTTGGSSHNNEAKIVMHNHSSRPSGEPTYLSWSKTANLTMNETTSVAITDSAVLTAIQNGTMKGFGLKHTFDKEHYMKCTGVIKATVTYTD